MVFRRGQLVLSRARSNRSDQVENMCEKNVNERAKQRAVIGVLMIKSSIRSGAGRGVSSCRQLVDTAVGRVLPPCSVVTT